MQELAALAESLELTGSLLAGVLVLARVLPLVYLVPFLGGPTLSTWVRLAVALAVTAAVLPVAWTGPPEVAAAGLLLLLMLKEVLVGACLGLLGAVAFHTLGMAGQLVDTARGTTQSQTFDPMTGEEQSPLASLHFQLGVALFLVLGGHRAFVAALAGSYEMVPMTTLPAAPEGLGQVALLAVEMTGAALAAALLIAAPAVTAIVLTDVALGLLGRTAPQVGTYFMAMPLRAAVGLAVVLLGLGVLLPDLGPLLGSAVEAVRRASTLLGGGS